MPVPKKRHSKSRQGKRRSQTFKAKLPKIVKCKSCGGDIFPHFACQTCGTYNGKVAVKIKVKKPKDQKAKE